MGDAPPPQEHLVVVLRFPEPTALLDQIRDKFPAVHVSYVHLKPGDVVPKELLKSMTILCTLNYLPDPTDVPRLKLVHVIAAGVDHIINHPIITDTNITVTTVSGIAGPPIAEWVIMNWLVSSRHYDDTAEWQKDHHWPKDKESKMMMSVEDHVNKRVGILGYGAIGRQVGRVATAMGMDVLAYTFSPRPTPESRRDTGYIVPGTGDPDGTLPISWHSGPDKASLHKFLSQGLGHLLVSVPLTPATTHFLSTSEFSILSQSCSNKSKGGRKPFLTNISRGKVLDQDALMASLRSGELSGAAIDVTDPEPLPEDHPLWDTPNLHISPHVSSLGVEYIGRAFDVLTLNLGRLERSEKLINVYHRKKGY